MKKMMQGKKGMGIIVKLFVFVLVVFVVLGAFWSLLSTARKTGENLVTKNLDQYRLQANSFVHPDLSVDNSNFWNFRFLNFIITATHTNKYSCYGTFYTLPDYEKLKGWIMTFSQQGEDITISLKDPRSVLAASYPAQTNELAGTRLCIETSGGTEIDVHEINILFNAEKSYYYTTESLKTDGKKTEFYYQPYQKDINQKIDRDWFILKDDTESNLFFFSYKREPKKLCITPVHKNGDDNSLSFDWIKDLFKNSGYPEYEAFCDVPKNAFTGKVSDTANLKQCFYTPCNTFDNDWIATKPSEEELGKSLEQTSCYDFSSRCGQICIPDIRRRATYNYLCNSCAKYESCNKIDNEYVCALALKFCGSNYDCQWDDGENKCIPK